MAHVHVTMLSTAAMQANRTQHSVTVCGVWQTQITQSTHGLGRPGAETSSFSICNLGVEQVHHNALSVANQAQHESAAQHDWNKL